MASHLRDTVHSLAALGPGLIPFYMLLRTGEHLVSPAAEQLYRSALTLSEADRVALAEALLEPPAPALTGEAYVDELRRRSAETGAGVWTPWEEARRRVHQRLGLPEPGDG